MALPKWLYPWKTNTAHPSTGPVYPQSVQELDFELKARPVYLAGVINTTQNAIRNAGLDTQDELWYQASSYNMTGWALAVDDLLTHNIIDPNHIVTESTVSVVSSADLTLTAAASTNEKIIVAGIQNDTRAPQPQLTITPNGMTAAVLTGSAGTTDVTNYMIGGASSNGLGIPSGVNQPIWLQATDTAKIEDLVFVAADVMKKLFITEVYGV